MKKTKNKIVFVAIDTSNLNQAKKIINHTQKHKLIPKFGLQFFYSKNGRKFLEDYRSEFMLDIKASDIPQTISSALHSIRDLKPKYLTVMASVGLQGLKAFKKEALKINKSVVIFGVTILTSLNNKSLKEIGYKDRVEKLVLKQASLIKKAGLKGIVASGSEAKIIRKKYKNLFILTPGIKLPGDKKNWDQSRVNTPNSAFKAGASAIVLGRSLVSGNLKKNIKKLKDHLNQ